MTLKQKPWRDKKYGKFIRENLSCCITGSTHQVVNHHIIGHGYSGMGTKAPDYLQMALSHDLHQELHHHGWKAFEEKHGICQKVMVTETLLASHGKGYFDINQFDLPDWFHELKDFFNE